MKNQIKTQMTGMRNAVLAAVLAMGGGAGMGTASGGQLTLAGVTLLPETTYELEVELTLRNVGSVLGLLGDEELPLQLLDGEGNLLGGITSNGLLSDMLGDLLGTEGTVHMEEGLFDTLDPLLDDLLGGLLGDLAGVDGVLEILGPEGEVLDAVLIRDVLELLEDTTNDVTMLVTVVVETASEEVIDPVLSILESPLIQLGDTVSVTTVQPPGSGGGTVMETAVVVVNRTPSVRVTKRKVRGDRLILRGTAGDSDGSIQRVEVVQNGRVRKARGRETWRARLDLTNGRRIAVRAIDNARAISQPTRVRVSQK